MLYPANGTAKGFSRYSPDIVVVISAKIIDEDGFGALYTVPRRQRSEILADWVIGAVISNLGDSDLIIACRECAIVGVHIADELCVVRVSPEPRRVLPRHLAFDFHAVRQLIETDALEVVVVFHDKCDVVQAVLQYATTVALERPGPVLELRRRCRLLFLQEQGAHTLIFDRKIHHCGEGLFLIVIAEFVNADEVESVEQFAAGWVGGVMAVSKFVIIDHDTSAAFTRNVIVAAFRNGRRIDVSEERIDDGGDTVGAAESSNHTSFCKRVLLFLLTWLANPAFSRCSRQQRTIPPVWMCLQNCIRVEQFAVEKFTEVFSVGRAGRPVHKLIWDKGALVKHVDADVGGHIARNRNELICGNITRKWSHNTETGRFRRMAVRGVHRALEGQLCLQRRNKIWCCIVEVGRPHGAASHVSNLAEVVSQMPADEAAFVFYLIALGLRELGIFLHCFSRAYRRFQPFAYILKGHGLV